MRSFSVRSGNLTLECRLIPSGRDLNVTVTGGSSPHIGSVSLAVPRPSLRGDGSTSATVSTLNLTGHKDGELGDEFARALSSVLNCVTVVTCGVHTDGLDAAGIETYRSLAESLRAEVLSEMKKEMPFDGA